MLCQCIPSPEVGRRNACSELSEGARRVLGSLGEALYVDLHGVREDSTDRGHDNPTGGQASASHLTEPRAPMNRQSPSPASGHTFRRPTPTVSEDEPPPGRRLLGILHAARRGDLYREEAAWPAEVPSAAYTFEAWRIPGTTWRCRRPRRPLRLTRWLSGRLLQSGKAGDYATVSSRSSVSIDPRDAPKPAIPTLLSDAPVPEAQDSPSSC